MWGGVGGGGGGGGVGELQCAEQNRNREAAELASYNKIHKWLSLLVLYGQLL